MQNNTLFDQAKTVIPGGVNSPVRAFNAVGGTPKFIQKAKGAYVYDVEGKSYVDYVGSWGPMILGHADDEVIAAVQKQAELGLSYGAPTSLEIDLAETVCRMQPHMEQVRFVNSGTEATMSAIRLARAFTKRSKIIKFNGCYHGHSDALLVKAGSGALTFGHPSSPGVPEETTQHTLALNFNDVPQITEIMEAQGDEIAAIILEPIAGNMNFVRPKPGYLELLRELCNQHDTILIFDEVMTGFRVHPKGVQGLYNIKPDLTTLGKIIGGGMPVGAFGGRKDIMSMMAPCGPVYQAGTLSGNPIAMIAGLTTLNRIENDKTLYTRLAQKAKTLTDGIKAAAKKHNIALKVDCEGGMFGLFFTEATEINSLDDVTNCNNNRFNRFFHYMLDHGHYLAPSAFEAGFVSDAHTDKNIQDTITTANAFFEIEAKGN